MYVHAIIVRLHLELPWIYYVHAMKLGHDLIRYLCSHEVVLDAVLLHFTCFTLIIKISEYLPQETKFRLSTMVWNINCEGGRIGLQAMEYKCNGEWEGEGERDRESGLATKAYIHSIRFPSLSYSTILNLIHVEIKPYTSRLI